MDYLFLTFLLMFSSYYFLLTAPGSPPEKVLARAASATTVIVQWDEPEIPNGIIQVSSCFVIKTRLKRR